MLLSRLPQLMDEAVDPRAAFAGTLHINEGYSQLQRAYAFAAVGEVPDPVPCEIYCHSLSDRSILGADLAGTDAQTLTLFALHLPARLFRASNDSGTSNAQTNDSPLKDSRTSNAQWNDAQRAVALAATMRSLNSVLAEPVEDLIMRDGFGGLCLEARTPLDLEVDLGLPGGNIFHRSLQWPWAQSEAEAGSWGVETAYERVLVCGAGARRGGGVSGIPGHNAAQRVLEM